MNRVKIIILGSGQIGSAVHTIITRNNRSRSSAATLAHTLIESSIFENVAVEVWDSQLTPITSMAIDFAAKTPTQIAIALRAAGGTHVINALPFLLNEKVAQAAVWAGCHYIDFTEDDVMAEKVKQLYASTSLTCAVKCGLAPGFINYLGHSLATKIADPEKLMICVGALPKNVSYADGDGAANYALSWSVDGLVNEYIRPCHARIDGTETDVPALSGLENVLLNGVRYEAAFTSGGIGNLISELSHIPNVYYKTLRYPGHYAYVKQAVAAHQGDHDAIKKEFLEVFPFCTDDIIVVYGECTGRAADGTRRKESFAAKFTGANGLSAIQSTTAGGGVAVLELMLQRKIAGTVNHASIPLAQFMNTETYKQTYFYTV